MRRSGRTPFISLIALVLASCAMPEAPARKALVYGISRYDVTVPASSYPNLTWTDEDASSMSMKLSESGWSVTEGIADSAINADNLDASRDMIMEDIESLRGFDGLVLFYYSGHGSRINGESTIIPYGTVSNPARWIRVSELYAKFESTGLSRVVIILDSCHSGGFVKEGTTSDAIPDVYGSLDDDGDISFSWFIDSLGPALISYLEHSDGSGYVGISAAGSGELSYESSAFGAGHGIFTYYMLESFTDATADIDGDGLVTSTELFAYCSAHIDATWNSDNFQNYEYIDGKKTYADYLPHLSGTPREYALWATE